MTKLTLSSTYINRNIMVNHVSECAYKLSYQPNCMRLKISFLICFTKYLVIQIILYCVSIKGTAAHIRLFSALY